jgi:hypothetical protein
MSCQSIYTIVQYVNNFMRAIQEDIYFGSIIINFYYDHINFNLHRCYECKNISYESGNCECWYSSSKL